MAFYGGKEPPGSVAVAVSGSRSEMAVSWAAENLFPDARRVLLLHVIPSISAVPEPSGRLVPIGEGRREVVEVYEKERKLKALQDILPFKKLCRTKGEVEILVFDGDCVADVLLRYVSESGIENLVLGGSSWTWFKRLLKGPDVPSAVLKSAPSSLSVYVVSRHNLIIKMAHQPVTTDARIKTRQKTFTRRGGSARFDRQMSISSSLSADLGDDAAFPVPAPPDVNCPNTRADGDVGAMTTDSENPHAYSSSAPARERRKRRYFSNVFLESRALEKHDFLGSFRDKPPVLSNSKSQRSQREDSDEVERLRLELRNTLSMYNQACKDLVHARQKVQTLSAECSEEARRARDALRREEVLKRIAAEEKAKHLLALREAREARRLLVKEASERREREPEAGAITEASKKQANADGLFSGHSTLRRYSRDEIETATDFFSPARKIGEGGFGIVYKAVLDHTPVAVKILREDAVGRRDEFLREVEVLSQLRHPHLLMLLGACPESGCLVYEYMENGSVEDRLFLRREGTRPLPWYVRVRIIFEVARGLAFLHGSKPEPIVHRDLKPGNILLDRNLVSKIGDVGLAKLVPRVVPDGVTEYRETVLAGTLHYMDPEYQRTGTLRPKSDLYAFGVVALQLLTAAPPMGLATMVASAIEGGRFPEVIDRTVPEWPLAQAERLARMCLRCCQLRCRDRPDLESEVIPELARLADMADSSSRLSPSPGAAPAHFFCPILQVLMENPYIAADGFSYEYRAIKAWVDKQKISPVTRFKLQHTCITPNHSLRSAIQEWKSGLTAQY